jgi:hypothetical protein
MTVTETIEATLREVADAQPKALRTIQENDFRFDDIGREPGNWQHLAFSLYTTICDLSVSAEVALNELEAGM